MFRALVLLIVTGSAFGAQSPSGQAAADPTETVGQIKKARELSRQGDQVEAIAIYRRVLQISPNSFEACLGLGAALDLKGRYVEARRYIAKAIEAAPEPKAKEQAQRAMAISYAFERKASEAARYEQQVFDAQKASQDFTAAGETADELGRIYLESGDLDSAYNWYQSGYETAMKKPGIADTEKMLWGFRWETAQARIAARRGHTEVAQKDTEAAKSFLDNLRNPQQERFYPYLTGYVAFYEGNYTLATTELQRADQHDPLVLALLAQAYEKSGDKSRAMDCYRQVLTLNMHNPANALARPIAKEKLKA